MAAYEIDSTICAVSTPPGCGGIAVVRISGPKAIEIADSVWKGRSLLGVPTHTARLGTVLDSENRPLDEAVATVFRAPKSFTGQDTVEFSVHGSRWIQREAVLSLIAHGARAAEPGEFTRRAFASGRLDLSQAEAVADLIASSSRAAARIALGQMRGGISSRLTALRERLTKLAALLELELDFSEEDVEFASRDRLIADTEEILAEINRLLNSYSSGAAIKDGIPVAIAGATNAGKSSLLNALLGEERAIVSDIHGTTRDTVEDTLEIDEFLFRFIDTAGIRHTDDTIERLGIERSRLALASARIILHVIDSTAPSPVSLDDAPSDARIITVYNKTDIADRATYSSDDTIAISAPASAADGTSIAISAQTGQGLDDLRRLIADTARRDTAAGDEDAILITNARHADALRSAAGSARALLDGLRTTTPADLLAQDLRETLHHLATITGQITTTDILTTIFQNFCIGK